ncbi:MAG: hypothetical protein NT061_06745 [Spirochaetes bacterium]|nr:hypothetical protein [Spirochaetota bacterium]
MTTRNLITLDQVSEYFHIEMDIISDFADFGLFPTIRFDGEIGIELQNVDNLAEIICLYQALGINKEGIEVIRSLRERISGLKDEVERLRNTVERLECHLESENPELLRRRGLLIDINN